MKAVLGQLKRGDKLAEKLRTRPLVVFFLAGSTMPRSFPKALRAIIAIVILLVIVESPLILTDKPTAVYFPGHHSGQVDVTAVNWSRFAYTQYVTNTAYLCNSVMLFETLHRLNSKPDRVMMYPSEFSLDENSAEPESRLLRKARDEYNVKLVPIKVQSRASGDGIYHPVL